MSKYLEFTPFDKAGKKAFMVFNKKHGNCLGKIAYYKPWDQYVFDPVQDSVFSDDCLMDIVKKILWLNRGG